MADYTGYQYAPYGVPHPQQPGQAQQANSAYPLQNIPGVTGGLNDMMRSALQANPNLIKNLGNKLMGSGGPLNTAPPDPTMNAIFTPPPATSSDTAVQ
jgi:hypothetical protein